MDWDTHFDIEKELTKVLQLAHHVIVVRLLQHLPIRHLVHQGNLMLARRIARNSASVLAFAVVALLLFCAVYYAFAVLDTLTMFLWSLTFPVPVIVGVAVLAFALIITQTYRQHPAPYMLPDATGELRSWLMCIAAVDILLSVANFLTALP